jgi:hypothetical protein
VRGGNIKGRMAWVPKGVLDELDNIQRNFEVETRADAFEVMTKYAKAGRQFDIFAQGFGLPRRKGK